LFAGLASVAAILAITATSALASTVPASWSQLKAGEAQTGEIGAPAPITIYKAGASPTSCSQAKYQNGFAWNEGSAIFAPIYELVFKCPENKYFDLAVALESGAYSSEAGYTFTVENGTASFGSPWGAYAGNGALTKGVSFTNGSGSAPSSITLTKDDLGALYSGGAHISVSGTFTVTLEKGALLTLTH
jgi:hypothetical protein